MRIITEKSIAAFLANRDFRNTNTTVQVGPMRATLKLHGNPIATKEGLTGQIQITTSGWNTRTTCERLNGIPGVRVSIKSGCLHLNGELWDGKWIDIRHAGNIEKQVAL